MKLSVFYHHILEAARQKGSSVPTVLAQAQAMGIQGLECSIEEVQSPGFDALLGASGMEVSSIYAFFDFGATAQGSPAFGAVDAAVRVGAPQIMVIPGFVRSASGSATVPQGVLETAIANMITGVAQVCGYAQTQGIGVNMEDFDDAAAPYATHHGLRRFLDAIPSLGCAFDTGNFRYSGVDEVEALQLLSDRIVHLHCKDRALQEVPGGEAKAALDGTIMYPAPTGHGTIRMKHIVETLLNRGYHGWFVIEHFGAPDYMSYMEESARWLLNSMHTLLPSPS